MNFARRLYWRARGWLHKPSPSSSTGSAAVQTDRNQPSAAQQALWADGLIKPVLLFEAPEADDFVAAFPIWLDQKRAPLIALEKELADLGCVSEVVEI